MTMSTISNNTYFLADILSIADVGPATLTCFLLP